MRTVALKLEPGLFIFRRHNDTDILEQSIVPFTLRGSVSP